MILDATAITELQSCARKFSLAQRYRPVRWNPKYLHDACLRKAVLLISQRQSPKEVSAEMKAQFLQAAACPGLDVTGSPFYVAREWATLLEVLIYNLPRVGVPPDLNANLSVDGWQVLAFADHAGRLHRYLTVDRWDAERMRKEVHSWHVAGDLAVANTSMTLHVIEIGQTREGQRQSLWVRGYKHPAMPQLDRIRFVHKDGKPMKGWLATRFADGKYSVEDWSEQLWRDRAGDRLIHTVEVGAPSPAQRAVLLRDIKSETVRMAVAQELPWPELPMSRGACDQDYRPCPFQPVCYQGVDLATSGLYQLREAPLAPRLQVVQTLPGK